MRRCRRCRVLQSPLPALQNRDHSQPEESPLPPTYPQPAPAGRVSVAEHPHANLSGLPWKPRPASIATDGQSLPQPPCGRSLCCRELGAKELLRHPILPIRRAASPPKLERQHVHLWPARVKHPRHEEPSAISPRYRPRHRQDIDGQNGCVGMLLPIWDRREVKMTVERRGNGKE